MKRNRPFFPTVLSTKPMVADPSAYQNEVVGGLSVRDAMSVEFLSALLSNPAYVGAKMSGDQPITMATLRKIAIENTDSLLAMLGED